VNLILKDGRIDPADVISGHSALKVAIKGKMIEITTPLLHDERTLPASSNDQELMLLPMNSAQIFKLVLDDKRLRHKV
jgi:CheY-specific phosphatase CheX